MMLQEENSEAGIFGLAPMYQISDWSILLPIIMDIRAHPISLSEMPRRANQNTSARARREDRFSILSVFLADLGRVFDCILTSRFSSRCSFVRSDGRSFAPTCVFYLRQRAEPASRLA
jgi:hypothetical protein